MEPCGREDAVVSERREPERYAELLLLLEGAAAARSALEGMAEEGEVVDPVEIEGALEPLQRIGRVPPGAVVHGGRGRPLEVASARDAEPALQEFRAGSIPVDYSGEELDDLDRVIGALVYIEPEEGGPGCELLHLESNPELTPYHAEWGIATAPGDTGVWARLDLEFRRPRRLSLRLLFDVSAHQWALRALELSGRCVISVPAKEGERRVRVRAPRSAQLTSALTVVRMLDQLSMAFEEV